MFILASVYSIAILFMAFVFWFDLHTHAWNRGVRASASLSLRRSVVTLIHDTGDTTRRRVHALIWNSTSVICYPYSGIVEAYENNNRIEQGILIYLTYLL